MSARKVSLIILALIFINPASIFANPKVEVKKIEQEIQKLEDETEEAIEDYNKVAGQYEDIKLEMKKAKIILAEQEKEHKQIQEEYQERMRFTYREDGELVLVKSLLDSESFKEVLDIFIIIDRINVKDSQIMKELTLSQQQVTYSQYVLIEYEKDFKEVLQEKAKTKAKVVTKLANRRQRLISLNLQNSRAYHRPKSSYKIPKEGLDNKAVMIAAQQIGKPYVWAATGPNSFDCSGLVVYVYAKLGIGLPHYSAAQIGYGTRVNRENLMPGDLVFFGSPRIHHVGIYAGDNLMIHAPHTGALVRIDQLHSNYSGATRLQ